MAREEFLGPEAGGTSGHPIDTNRIIWRGDFVHGYSSSIVTLGEIGNIFDHFVASDNIAIFGVDIE
jgi:hypothetical protein